MPSAHLQLANLYLKRYEMAAASSELQACLRANPSDPQAPAIKKMLASIAANQKNERRVNSVERRESEGSAEF
jgi:Tfp pilus assembly protein PilF